MLKFELVQTDKHSIKILLRRKNLRFLDRTNLMRAESNERLKNRYATVYKMVEPTHRCCPAGESIKGDQA